MLLDPLEVLTRHAGGSVGAAIGAFSVLAIATSFIGTTLGKSNLACLTLHLAVYCPPCMPCRRSYSADAARTSLRQERRLRVTLG